MRSNTGKVSIGIVTYNSRDVIKPCFDSLRAQTYENIEIIFLDNASSDGSADFIEKEIREALLIRSDENLGFGKAHNKIISGITGEYYLPINPDMILSPGFIEAMLDAIHINKQIGWVSGRIYFNKKDDEAIRVYSVGHAITRDGRAFNIGYGLTDREQFNDPREVFGASGAAPLYKTEMLQDLFYRTGDIFDEVIFLDLEDVDLDWRARLLGWKCMYAPDAIAYHIGGHSRQDTTDLVAYQSYANRYYIALKNNALQDILFLVIPHYFCYITVVSFLNPRKAFYINKIIMSRIKFIMRKRKVLYDLQRQRKKEMRAWFRWSMNQPGYQHSIDIKVLGDQLRTLSKDK